MIETIGYIIVVIVVFCVSYRVMYKSMSKVFGRWDDSDRFMCIMLSAVISIFWIMTIPLMLLGLVIKFLVRFLEI